MAKGFDPSEILQQARKMKDQMAKTQEALKARVVEAEWGGGLVKVFANGSSEIVGVSASGHSSRDGDMDDDIPF